MEPLSLKLPWLIEPVLFLWTNDGNFTILREPAQAISVNVSNGFIPSVWVTSITNMQALPGSVFQDHNDAHLRIWIRLGSTG